MNGRVIALLGAESTGKTALAQALAQALQRETGAACTWVPEWLRLWCEREGRTPRVEEQAEIAAEQTRRISQAAQTHEWVVADTTAVMTAVYSEMVFADRSLWPAALRTQQDYALTLLTGNDLPWLADGLQRDGPHVREPVAQALRGALDGAGILWRPVEGSGSQRLECALAHVKATLY